MSNRKQVSVRVLNASDFEFVREIASKQPNFTIPPPYVLWLLLKIGADLCLIAESPQGDRLAYILAVPMSEPGGSIFVWQLATTDTPLASVALLRLVKKLKEICDTSRTRTLFFTAIPGTGSMRMIKHVVREVFATEPREVREVDRFVAPGETEFRIDLNLSPEQA